MPRGSGGGGSGPALTHTASQYPPAQLTAVLKAPTAKMKAAGMVPLTLNAADMKALVSYVSSLGGTSAASAATPPASGSPSPAAPKAEPAATSGPSKAPAGSSASNASTVQGKDIYVSQHCSGCHGNSGAGGSGPALTLTASQYTPAQLTVVLKAPTAEMKAAGMVPLTVNAADLTALVSYVSSLGRTPAASAATPPSAGSYSTAPSAAEPSATAVASKAPAGNWAGDATVARGKSIFDSQGCNGCHGEGGGGGTGPALAHISSQYSPAQMAAVQIGITAVLKAPTAQMKAGGMGPLSLNSADMEALVSYVSRVGGASVAPAPPAAASSSPAPTAAGAGAAAAAAPSKAPSGSSPGNAATAQGKAIFDSQHCSACHGGAGGGGPGQR